MLDLLLGDRRRLAANLAQEHRLPSLLLLLTVATVAFALPFGAVLGLARTWRVAALLLGGVAMCVPSLHVFARYVGVGLSYAQTLSLSLVGAATTAVFTFAFAPIVGFFRATMSGSAIVTPGMMATWLLTSAFAAGIGQLIRVALGNLRTSAGSAFVPILIPWLMLYLFITIRLAGALDVIP